MDCPHCGTEPLVALEYQRVEVDYCAQCRGVWLDSGEIELLYGDAAAAREFLRSRNPVPRGEQPRRCPECRGRMLKEATDGAPPVVYDRCPRGCGVWLDRGELEAVLASAAPAARDNEVLKFLKEVFPSPNNSAV